MSYFIADFKKDRDSKDNKKGIAQIGGGALILHQGYRHGIPRSLGVRLESHSTGATQARDIIKNGGYLDPNKMGGVTGSAMGDIYGDAKKYTFITGAHPSVKAYGADRMAASSLRGSFRTMGSLPKHVNDALLKESLLHKLNAHKYGYKLGDAKISQVNSVFGSNYKNIDEAAKDLNNLVKANKLSTKNKFRYAISNALNPIVGKSLFVGGGNDYFRKNFTPDEDMVTLAMKSPNPIKVSSTRAGAVRDAIKREGLGNLMKKNKGRVATGIGLLTASGLGGGYLIKKGVDNVKSKKKQK